MLTSQSDNSQTCKVAKNLHENESSEFTCMQMKKVESSEFKCNQVNSSEESGVNLTHLQTDNDNGNSSQFSSLKKFILHAPLLDGIGDQRISDAIRSYSTLRDNGTDFGNAKRMVSEKFGLSGDEMADVIGYGRVGG